MSNAIEFISSYNRIDARLRALYRGKGNLNFTDLVRRSAEFNPTVKRYEEELLSFARLRNAIVHESKKEYVIAEPCDEATNLISRIAELLCTPPKLSVLKPKKVAGVEAEAPLSEAIRMGARTGYSNLPVYRKGRMVGMLGNRRIVWALGRALERGDDLAAVLQTPCGEIVAEEDMMRFYKVLSKGDTVQSALDAFADNRKLLAVVVTETGFLGDPIVDLLTAADIPRLMQLLEE